MVRLHLPYGSNALTPEIPDRHLGEVVQPCPVRPADDALAIIRSALEQPIGTCRLDQMVDAGQTVAVIVDDLTRTTPVRLILPLVLQSLHAAGVAREAVRIVLALGTHRAMTEAEIIAKVGAEIPGQYTVVNISGSCREEMVYMGTSSYGIPTWINRAVAQADVKIGVGQITPHVNAGYSGGAKIILPGVCGTHTVETFHAKETDLDANLLGWLDSPLRQDLEAFVRGRVGLDFIVNAIMTSDHHLYQCVAGHAIAAHRAGVRYAQEVYSVSVSRRYPIVVANAYPKDMDLWQSTNAIWSGALMIEDGGSLILVANAWDGHSAYPTLPQRLGSEPVALKRAFDAGETSDPMTAIFGIVLGRIRRRFDIALISAGLTPTDAAMMGFAYHETVEQALHHALLKHSPEAKVAILTHGGITFPIVSDDPI
jgi:nickel-dependent lactate racemase